MHPDEIVKALQPWLDKVQRPAWKALVVDEDGAPTAAKFAGTPWLAVDETWPACQSCAKPMPLFLQLDLDQLPAKLAGKYGTGLLQLYYCTECDGGWEPFSLSNLARVVHPTGTAQANLPQELVEFFPAKRIVDWQEFVDYPNPQEYDEHGLQVTYDWDHDPVRVTIHSPELGVTFENIENSAIVDTISNAASGDKLGGWAHWIQGVEYPSCPQCQATMILVFQLDSEDNLPYMFGDVGTGHITQCPTHKEVVAFGWACS